AAQCRHPHRHRTGAADGLHAWRRHRRRDNLHAARRRPDDARRRPRAQLPGRAGPAARHGRDVHARQPPHRHPVRRHRPAREEAVTRGALQRRWAGPQGVALAGLCLVGALVLAALCAPAILPGSPTAIAKDHALRGPTVAEPFGMDDLGRSVLSRVVHAYRVSLGVAVGSVVLALLIGGPLGLIAGYAEGVPDQLIMRPLDVLMAFPAILLAIALMSVFGTGAALVSISLAVVYTPVVARVVRAA